MITVALIGIFLYHRLVVKKRVNPQLASAAQNDVVAPIKKGADVSWEGDTHDTIKSWPPQIRIDFGNSLREMQDGRPAKLDVRPMTSIGPGVFELKTDDDKTWYRMVYLARIENVIYVLDCFEKDGRKTERKDLKTAASRLAQVKQKLMEERRNEKRKERNEQARPHH